MKYSILLAALMALSLTACGNKEEAQAPAAAPEAAAPATPAPETMAPASEAMAPATPAPEAAAPTPEAATQATETVKEAATSMKETAKAAVASAASMADAAAGEAKYKTVCASCHGARAQGQGVFPKLAGLSAADIKAKLELYRKGEKVGPMTATMAPMAKALSDADVENVSAYIATIK